MIFAEGNQRDYMYQKHSVMTFLNKLTQKNNVLIAYHGAAAGEVSAVFIIKFLQKKKINKYSLYNFAELRNKEFTELEKKIKSKKYDKLIVLEGFGLPQCFEKFNDIAINIDSHFNDNEPIRTFLNPVAAKFSPIPSTSLVIYDLLREFIPEKYKWLVAVSSILDYSSEAAQLIIQDCKDSLQKLTDIRYTFWSCQYVEKAGDLLISKLVEKPTVALFETDKELISRKNQFLKKINEHIEKIKKTTKGGPIYYEVESDTFRLTSPLASFLMDQYSDRLIFIVEKFKDSDDVRISARYGNPEINIGKICQKFARIFEHTDAVKHNDTASFRTKKKMIKPIFDKLKQYC